jgi:aminoacrylate peracid reductase
MVFVSGVLSMGDDGAIVGSGDVLTQTRRVLEIIRSVVEAAGGSMNDIVFNQIFLKDLSDYAGMNSVYKEFFPNNFPARYCIRADLVKPEFLVEIASTAHIPKASG